MSGARYSGMYVHYNIVTSQLERPLWCHQEGRNSVRRAVSFFLPRAGTCVQYLMRGKRAHRAQGPAQSSTHSIRMIQ